MRHRKIASPSERSFSLMLCAFPSEKFRIQIDDCNFHPFNRELYYYVAWKANGKFLLFRGKRARGTGMNFLWGTNGVKTFPQKFFPCNRFVNALQSFALTPELTQIMMLCLVDYGVTMVISLLYVNCKGESFVWGWKRPE